VYNITVMNIDDPLTSHPGKFQKFQMAISWQSVIRFISGFFPDCRVFGLLHPMTPFLTGFNRRSWKVLNGYFFAVCCFLFSKSWIFDSTKQ